MHILRLQARQSAGCARRGSQGSCMAYLDMDGAPHSLPSRAAVLVLAAQLLGQASLASACVASFRVRTERLIKRQNCSPASAPALPTSRTLMLLCLPESAGLASIAEHARAQAQHATCPYSLEV